MRPIVTGMAVANGRMRAMVVKLVVQRRREHAREDVYAEEQPAKLRSKAKHALLFDGPTHDYSGQVRKRDEPVRNHHLIMPETDESG